jgi:hypothetical protein
MNCLKNIKVFRYDYNYYKGKTKQLYLVQGEQIRPKSYEATDRYVHELPAQFVMFFGLTPPPFTDHNKREYNKH